MKIYGIKNCDSVKKALKFFDSHNIKYEFIDYRENPIPANSLGEVIDQVGLDKIVNKRSTSYRELSESDKKLLDDKGHVTELIKNNPTLIKRPLIFDKGNYHIGFNENKYKETFSI